MTERPNSADGLMKELYVRLASDFRGNGVDLGPCSDRCVEVLTDDLRAFRAAPPLETTDEMDPYTYKCRYQLNSLFKRWIFSNDVHTQADLVEKSEKKFSDNQHRLKSLQKPGVQDKAFWAIVALARRYCTYVLGEYRVEEHLALCRFGSRATVGVPLSKASESQRWETPMTGSNELIEWFHFHVVSEGQRIEDYLDAQVCNGDDYYRSVSSLAVTLVPKRFDSLRSIVANTTIGNFHSSGLGKMLEKRLRRHGYDISVLQEIHRELARQASIDGELVTCDQSLSSDNVTRWLCSLLLPGPWFREMDRGRIGVYKVGTTEMPVEMFAGMGIGYTFGLQTLIYLSLLKAIVRYYHIRNAKISAFGDDLIYSRSLHKYVIKHFPQFGLIINESKTFSEGRFRESCGGDFFAGVDVRPFQPETAKSGMHKKLDFLALIYKTINGLCYRWDVEDIPRTLTWLMCCLEDECKVILVVPSDYPDFSGIKESTFDRMWHSPSFMVQMVPVSRPRTGKDGVRRSLCIGVKPKYNKEFRHEPILWAATRAISSTNTDYRVPVSPVRSKFARNIARACGTDRPAPLIIWKTEITKPKGNAGNKKSGGKGLKALRRRRLPFIAAFSDDVHYVTQVSPTPKKKH